MFEARTERIASRRTPDEGGEALSKTGLVSSMEFIENASKGGGIGYERR